ncbi:MAG: hypothetical protein M1817_003101 [Caeruleum heppii]|nr:MAG: hypothetical protein M1817_003101 [Caeruleum heppii]
MPCCGSRKKEVEVRQEQKWDYINLSDFRSTSCLTPLSYGILYISLFISIAIYAVDTFLAVKLLAFNRWSGSVEPLVPFRISKVVFATCIILSFVNLAFEWHRALRVMKRGGIAESYLDPLAVRVQSIRPGKRGRGWRRFLVFAELTKSKKGVEYVALFSYYSFQAWVRVIFCEAPRQVINAITLYSVLIAKLVDEGNARRGNSPFVQFWINYGILAKESRSQALILAGMTFTLVIWVITAINLIVACVMYILFLWHYLPTADGGLSGFLKRKIDGRVNKIVAVKVKKALEKEDVIRRKEEAKAIKAGEKVVPLKREPTLPVLSQDGEFGGLSRQTTQTTLPPYTSTPPPPLAAREPTLPDMSLQPGMLGQQASPSRSGTQSSNGSHGSHGSSAPLVRNDIGMGYRGQDYGRSPSPAMSINHNGYAPSIQRTGLGPFNNRIPSPFSDTNIHTNPPAMISDGRRTPGTEYMGSVGRRTPNIVNQPPMQGRRPMRPPLSQNPRERKPAPLSTEPIGPYPASMRPPALSRRDPQPQDRDRPGLGPAFNPYGPASGPQLFRDELGGSGYGGYPAPLRGLPRDGRGGYRPPVARVPPPPQIVDSHRGPNRSASSDHLPYPNDQSSARMPRERAPPQRSGTAPLPHRSVYAPDSIYDAYGASADLRTREPFARPPPRAGTAGSGTGPGWAGHGGSGRPPPHTEWSSGYSGSAF